MIEKLVIIGVVSAISPFVTYFVVKMATVAYYCGRSVAKREGWIN